MTLEPRPQLSDADVWAFICEGCNANEIAAYAGIKVWAAYAWMQHATRLHAAAGDLAVVTTLRTPHRSSGQGAAP